MKLTKNQKIVIKTIADKLPRQSRVIQSGCKISGEDLLLSGHTEVEGKVIDPETEYIMNIPMYFECVHEKRISKIAKKKGFNGLIEYIKRYLSNKQINTFVDSLRLIWNSKNVIQ